jgi:hypothetical protein
MDAKKRKTVRRPRPVKRPEIEVENVIDDYLMSLAGLIRTIFVANYRRTMIALTGTHSTWGEKPMAKWDGGTNDEGTFQPIWPKVASLCLEYDLDPVSFVTAQFRTNSRPPSPNVLLSPTAITRYEHALETQAEELRRKLMIYDRVFAQKAFELEHLLGCNKATAARAAIRNMDADLSPLYRYSRCMRARDEESASRFHDAALIQYLCRHNAYDEFWGDLIPAILRDEAQRFLARFARKRR